ncbi:MAG: MerR family transcriptional regulator [Tepidimonas sp.]|nr:MerR family transcriptional regulator [Tepidimonas sp.]
MKLDVMRVEVTLEAPGLDAEALCRAAGVEASWWEAALQAGQVIAPGDGGFDAATLRRVRRLAWLQRHFDADPELAALVVDLEEEIDRLRARLRRLGG